MVVTSYAAAKLPQSCPTLCDPIDGSPAGSAGPGILQARTLEWVPFPSPMHESEKWKWSRSVVSDSSRPHRLWPTRLLHPWDFPGKSTGVGCHCLPGSILKSTDISLLTKVHLVKAMVFPVVMYRCKNWTLKKAEHWINAFEMWCWRRYLRVLWTARISNQSILKEISPEYSLEELLLKLKL